MRFGQSRRADDAAAISARFDGRSRRRFVRMWPTIGARERVSDWHGNEEIRERRHLANSAHARGRHGMVRGMETVRTLRIRQCAVDPQMLLTRENATEYHLVDRDCGSGQRQ